jgi:hypothetical protein
MCFSRLLFFICFILIHPVTPTVAQHVCSSGGNYTRNSTYGENLKSVLATMSSNTEIDYGFYNFSVGEYPDKVNKSRSLTELSQPEGGNHMARYYYMYGTILKQRYIWRYGISAFIYRLHSPKRIRRRRVQPGTKNLVRWTQKPRFIRKFYSQACCGECASLCQLPNNICTCAVHSGFGGAGMQQLSVGDNGTYSCWNGGREVRNTQLWFMV